MYSSKAQFDIMTIGIVVIMIIVLAPITFQLISSMNSKFTAQLNIISNKSANNVGYIENRFETWWDTGMMIAIIGNFVLLIISAFLIVVHPAFIIVFILMCMLSMIFIPQLLVIPDKIWSNQAFSPASIHLPMTQFILDHFGIIFLSVMIIAGVILYAKVMQNRSYG